MLIMQISDTLESCCNSSSVSTAGNNILGIDATDLGPLVVATGPATAALAAASAAAASSEKEDKSALNLLTEALKLSSTSDLHHRAMQHPR
jgi:hypothetical protein